MNREEMVAKLAQLNFDVSKLTDAVPDEAIAEILKAVEMNASAKPEQSAQPVNPQNQNAEEEDGQEGEEEEGQENMEDEEGDRQPPSDEEIDQMIAHLESMRPGNGDDEDQGEERYEEDDEEEQRRAEEEHQAQMQAAEQFAERLAEAHAICNKESFAEGDQAKLKNFVDGLVSDFQQTSNEEEELMNAIPFFEKFAEEVNGAFGTMKEYVDQSNAQLKKDILEAIKKTDDKATVTAQSAVAFAENLESEKRRAYVETFCENMLKEGKLNSAELDESNVKVPSVRAQLLAADSRTVVHKYSENGKEVGMTQLDMLMAGIRARQPQKFSEKTLAGKNTSGAANEVIKEHFEKFSETFEKQGISLESLQKGYEAEKKLNKDLTPEEFVGAA